ncbi:MAG: hypothetical protein FD164_856 [Nitrospirae bacterium]|nr:MAG: hypothetical protein FD164_856 [Nitrospirota bacterium]
MTLSDSIKGFILAVIVMGMFLYGFNYYRYSQTDPDFCSQCHQLKGAHADWLKSRHHDVLCQQCHQLGNIEQNVRLISYVLTGNNPIGVTHGRYRPWEECIKCHAEDMAQGSVSPSRAFGHARHVAMKQLACKECHSGTKHDFPSPQDTCEKCHQGKTVHGLESADFSCLKCHSFIKNPLPKFDRTRCTKCHVGIPSKGAMASLTCHYCHKPHKKEKPGSATCIAECHKSEASVGQHGVHWKKDIGCMRCHKPHSWRLTPERAKANCSACHAYRDPKMFKYIL